MNVAAMPLSCRSRTQDAFIRGEVQVTVALILHKRDQRQDHQRDAGPQEGGANLKRAIGGRRRRGLTRCIASRS